MPDKAFNRLHRVTDLFVNGRELVLADDGTSDPVLLWIKKPNAFELADVQRDAAAARSRRRITLGDDHEEIQSLRLRLESMKRDEVEAEIAEPERTTAWLQAVDDVQADPDWTERLELLRREPGLEANGSEATAEEREALDELNQQYLKAVEDATEARLADYFKELEDLDDDELHDKYVEVWRDQQSRAAWQAEYARGEIYVAARDCEATRDGNGGYSHAKCLHTRFCPSRAHVYDLPDELIERIQQVINDLRMTPAEAGNSAAPQSSSGSAEQPSPAEASSPSTPAAT